jgi:hypothetical protein
MKGNKNTDEIEITLISLIGFFILAKIIHSVFKKDIPNNEGVPVLSTREENKFEVDKLEKGNIDETSSIEISEESTKGIPQEISRNSWLYTTDSFGKLEKGRVH